MHGGLNVVGSLPYGVDGLMNGQPQGMPVGEMPVAHARHDVERAVDGERHDGQLQLVSQPEGTALELAHVTREAARAFGKHHDAEVALRQRAAGGVDGGLDLLGAALVNENLVRPAAGEAHEGNLAQLVLHHPLEVAAQIAVDEEDVKRSLMVGHEDVRLFWLQMLTAFDGDGQQTDTDDGLGPPTTGIVAPEVAVADSRADADGHCHHDGDNDQHRQHDEELINAVKILHLRFEV